jgi:7-carboxy-7-deazaguanine synthase
LSRSEKATALCVDACIARGWRLSLQLHKYLGRR